MEIFTGQSSPISPSANALGIIIPTIQTTRTERRQIPHSITIIFVCDKSDLEYEFDLTVLENYLRSSVPISIGKLGLFFQYPF